MSSPRILIMMGVSGSGKTEIGKRLAADLGWDFFDGDDFHPPENVKKMSRSIPLTDADREEWLEALRHLICQRLAAAQPAVVACSALKQIYRDYLKVDQSVQFIYLRGSYTLINQRLKSRTNHYMPSDLLNSQFEALEEPENALTIDVAQPPDVILQTIKEQI
jgi:gluconokinase